MVSKKIRVYGLVQGVGFRVFVQKQASNYEIKGIVKNLPDGSVYIEAEGEDGNVRNFMKKCEEGSYWSKVTNIDVEDMETKNFRDFIISR